MEDRYLFKAKRVDNGEWVEGSLISNKDHSFIVEPVEWSHIGYCLDCNRPYIDQFNVDLETICQCTGLTDANDNKIWENDIIHIGDKSIPYIVEWHDTGFKGMAVRAMNSIGLKHWSPKIEVIGNKFDNPELLEVKDEIN